MKPKQNTGIKRRSFRVDFRTPVQIFCPEMDRILKGILVNVSPHGMLIDLQDENISDVTVELTKNCITTVIFQGKGSKLMIDELQSAIVRIKNNMIALEFSEPLEWFLIFNVYKGKQIRK